MGISLEKKQELVKVILAKRNVPASVVMQVKLATDVSGSMNGLFASGAVQELVDRLLAVAIRFDDNKSIESYAFSHIAKKLSDIKPAMFGNYVNSRFMSEAGSVLWGGTDYSSALSLVSKDSAPSSGFFGFGKKDSKLPTYLVFVTDGETRDEARAEDWLKKMEGQNIYVQFVGLGYGSYHWIEKMGDKYDHVGFVSVKSLEATSDEQLYETLLSDELAEFIRKQP